MNYLIDTNIICEIRNKRSSNRSATFADVLYVLHAFQKKTRQTAKRDVDLAASRLREQMTRMR